MISLACAARWAAMRSTRGAPWGRPRRHRVSASLELCEGSEEDQWGCHAACWRRGAGHAAYTEAEGRSEVVRSSKREEMSVVSEPSGPGQGGWGEWDTAEEGSPGAARTRQTRQDVGGGLFHAGERGGELGADGVAATGGGARQLPVVELRLAEPLLARCVLRDGKARDQYAARRGGKPGVAHRGLARRVLPLGERWSVHAEPQAAVGAPSLGPVQVCVFSQHSAPDEEALAGGEGEGRRRVEAAGQGRRSRRTLPSGRKCMDASVRDFSSKSNIGETRTWTGRAGPLGVPCTTQAHSCTMEPLSSVTEPPALFTTTQTRPSGSMTLPSPWFVKLASGRCEASSAWNVSRIPPRSAHTATRPDG